MNTAYFVKRPRVAGDLGAPHLPESERPYTVAARVTLSVGDYENFASDMRVDRQFIEDAAAHCGEGEVMRCLLVRRRGGGESVLGNL